MTIKNIPDEVYEGLKHAAKAHRRSMNSEAIVCLEAVLRPGRMPVEERLARIRAVRVTLAHGELTDEDINAFKREGRP